MNPQSAIRNRLSPAAKCCAPRSTASATSRSPVSAAEAAAKQSNPMAPKARAFHGARPSASSSSSCRAASRTSTPSTTSRKLKADHGKPFGRRQGDDLRQPVEVRAARPERAVDQRAVPARRAARRRPVRAHRHAHRGAGARDGRADDPHRQRAAGPPVARRVGALRPRLRERRICRASSP